MIMFCLLCYPPIDQHGHLDYATPRSLALYLHLPLISLALFRGLIGHSAIFSPYLKTSVLRGNNK